jgi:hypothetical protein
MLVDEVYVLNVADTEWSVTVSRKLLKKVVAKAAKKSEDAARTLGISHSIAGLTNCLDGNIYIAPEGPESHRRSVLWHEVWHAAFESVGGLRVSSNPTEDDIITQLSQTLLDTLRRNGRLTHALLHDSPALKDIIKRTKRMKRKHANAVHI